jgi:hypothetical protein
MSMFQPSGATIRLTLRFAGSRVGLVARELGRDREGVYMSLLILVNPFGGKFVPLFSL